MQWSFRLSSLNPDKFIIAKDVSEDGRKVFGHIKMSELQEFIRNTDKNDRLFHERIHPNKRQKIFFDIDGEGEHDTTSFITPYILTITKCIKKYTSAPFQILLLSSCDYSDQSREDSRNRSDKSRNTIYSDRSRNRSTKSGQSRNRSKKSRNRSKKSRNRSKKSRNSVYSEQSRDKATKSDQSRDRSEKSDQSRDRSTKSTNGRSIRKISYHIVVDGLYVKDIYRNKRFANYVQFMFKKDYPDLDCLMDMGVYSVNQLFRLCFCRKNGTQRYKRLIPYTINGVPIEYKNIKNNRILLHTMVSYVDKQDRKLPIKNDRDFTWSMDDIPDIDDPEDIYGKYIDYCSINNYIPLRFRSTKNNIIYLDRQTPSICPVCSREHDHENAYLVYTGSRILFRCYRNNEEYVEIK